MVSRLYIPDRILTGIFKRPAQTTGHILLRRVELAVGMVKCYFQKVNIMTQIEIKHVSKILFSSLAKEGISKMVRLVPRRL